MFLIEKMQNNPATTDHANFLLNLPFWYNVIEPRLWLWQGTFRS